tara:strand:- start:300 stop:1088 length:789 start_codon:yes stop_codon:yes gene_type:complete
MLGLGASLSHGSSYITGGWANTHSAYLDGAADYLNTNSDPTFAFRGNFTVMGHFFLLDGQPAAAQTLFGVDAGGVGTPDKVHCFVDTDGTVVFDHVSNDDAATTTTDAAVFANGNSNAFVHIVVTVQKQGSGQGETLYKIYKDGAEVASTTANAMTGENHLLLDVSSSTLHFGAKGIGGNSPSTLMIGFIDEIALFKRTMAANEIAAAYNSDVVIDLLLPKGDYTPAKLSLYYHLDDNTTDSAGSSNATLTGGVFNSDFIAP